MNTPSPPQTQVFTPPPLLTPSLNPAVFDGDPNDMAIAAVKQALAVGLQAATQAYNASVAIHLDETKPEGGRHVQAAEYAFKITKPALEKFDSTAQRLANEIATLEKRLKGPPPPSPVVAAEVRGAFRGLNAKEKTKALHRAIEQGDDSSIGALLDGPLMLVGMGPIERELLAGRWAKERLPAEVKRLEELRKASVHLERGGKILLEYSMRMSDPTVVMRAKKSAEAAARAMSGAA
jgi:hypothetical protein